MRKVLTWAFALALATTVPLFAQATATTTHKGKEAKAAVGQVNLNTASQADLEALPGVGPATAKKIIAGRPFTSVSDLSRAGISKSEIDKISSMVTVGAIEPMTAPKPGVTERTGPTGTGGATVAQVPPEEGMVWVNLSTKVYHKEGDRYYGATKNGKFMTEQDAIKAGYKAAKTGGAKKTP